MDTVPALLFVFDIEIERTLLPAELADSNCTFTPVDPVIKILAFGETELGRPSQ